MKNRNTHRYVEVMFGMFFLALAVLILLAGWKSNPLGAVIAALVVGFLGADAIISTVRDKPSLLSRIGPLP